MRRGSIRANAWLAIVFGIVLAVGEFSRNWGDWQWWPSWLVDFIAAALLIGGGVSTLRKHADARALLAGAWGFTSAMFYGSFWSHIRVIDDPVSGSIDHGPLTVIIGVMWVVTIVGFVLSLLRERDPAA